MARPTRRTSFAVATLALFGATFFRRMLAREDPRDYGIASADLFRYYTFAPGWRATVHGTAAPILATNPPYRGVPAAGTHRVRFTYGPTSIPAGQAPCLVGIGILVWLARRTLGERGA